MERPPGSYYLRWEVEIPEDGWYSLRDLGVPDDAEWVSIDGAQVTLDGPRV